MEAVNLLAIAVRLRWGIPMQQFAEILNQTEKVALISTIARIKHLLLTPDGNDGLSLIFFGFFS